MNIPIFASGWGGGIPTRACWRQSIAWRTLPENKCPQKPGSGGYPKKIIVIFVWVFPWNKLSSYWMLPPVDGNPHLDWWRCSASIWWGFFLEWNIVEVINPITDPWCCYINGVPWIPSIYSLYGSQWIAAPWNLSWEWWWIIWTISLES